MDMLKDMNEAMHYIEEHLDEKIDFDEVAAIAGVSEYHFRKLFSYLSGMTLSGYIRSRRLSQAALDLQEGERVLDVAVKYGYDSADGFSRAFREWSGVNPSDMKNSTAFKLFPRLTFQLTIRGGMDMEYRIEEKAAFKLVGLKKRVPIVFEGQNPVILKMAQSITSEQREKLQSWRNTDVKTVVNASMNFDEGRYKEQGQLDHLIGSITTLEESFEGFDVVAVPAGKWAVFRMEGSFPQKLQETWAKIFSEWLPSSNCELVDGPEISFNGDMADLQKVSSEIWIPVKRMDS
ncbi:AraC family transcriptional regulator [Planomicrobium sp. CPCC 101079]|uniref:AraC family transcriptional regulator n=1 Tax=Planomicrobium sp. CPCC 101079 TaxID=2599618 RepID=UPI0011B4D74B|nr:AraC family transcriptional regulator [Planomicrobium sp. CPCC 101079]TWT01492.1 AraC family transcriptional regulator [Planomicrobium sp. CPCC 101079]